MTVTLRREDGRARTFRIVGEDEADPSRGTVSYVSPLARAVLTYGPGDTVEIAGGKAVILKNRCFGAKPERTASLLLACKPLLTRGMPLSPPG